MGRRVRTAAGVLLAAAMATGLLTSCDSARATVARVVDGDTVAVRDDDREQVVRLLNIDAPETKHPDKEVQCLGPEAADYLAALLPPGTPVEVLTDGEKIDGHGRLLAGLRLDDGRLVNAEVARAGLAVPMKVGSNDRFLAEVEQAQREAIEARRGLYGPAAGCTIPGQLVAVERAGAQLPVPPPTAGAGEVDNAAGAAATVAGTATALYGLLNMDLPSDASLVRKAAGLLPDRSALAGRAVTVASTAQRHERDLRERARILRTPPPPPARTPDPEPLASEAGGNSGSSGPAPVPRIRPTRPSNPDPEPVPGPRDSGGSGPAGYTGPRCYAPGGTTWKPC